MKFKDKVRINLEILYNTIEGFFTLHWWKMLFIVILYIVIMTTVKTCKQKPPATLDNSTKIDSLKVLVSSQRADIAKLKVTIADQKTALYIKDMEINRIVNSNIKTFDEYQKQIAAIKASRVNDNVVTDSIRSKLSGPK